MACDAPGHTLSQLAHLLDGTVVGNPDHRITGIADLQQAGPTDAAFLANAKYRKHFADSTAGVVLVVPSEAGDSSGKNLILVDDPYAGFARLSRLFNRRPAQSRGIHPSAVVDPSAVIDPSAAIGPLCVIEAEAVIGAGAELVASVYVGARSRVGARCLLYPQVSLYHDVSLGDGVTVHAATVIGSDGFGFAPTVQGWEKIYQLGGVKIEDGVEIGASCTIDRGALQDSWIGRGVIIDNQVHLAHNVRVGEYTAIAGCCGIAGSTTIGARCLLGGGVLMNGHLTICDGVKFNGATVVTRSITEPGTYSSGTPMQPVKQWQKNAVRAGQLTELFDRVKALEAQLASRERPADAGES